MNIPPGTRSRVSVVLGGAATIVLLPPGAEEPDPRTGPALKPGAVLSVIRFDAGVSWPDRAGRQLLEDGLDAGEPVLLEFAGLADALRCQERLRVEVIEQYQLYTMYFGPQSKYNEGSLIDPGSPA